MFYITIYGDDPIEEFEALQDKYGRDECDWCGLPLIGTRKDKKPRYCGRLCRTQGKGI